METMEKPARRNPRKDEGTGLYKSLDNAAWARLMAESLKGAEDKAMADKYGVPISTIRQRRYNDPAWRIAHDRLKELPVAGAKAIVASVQSPPLSIGEIANLNPDLIAKFTYESLKSSIEQGLIPLPTTWSEAKTAMEMMRKSTGQDDKSASVNITLWSGGSVSPAPSIAPTLEAEIVSQKEPDDWI